MTLNYIERMKHYNSLKQDFELQKLECTRKQDRIIELSREIRELKKEIEELKEGIENDRKKTRARRNTGNKKNSKRTNKQTTTI